MKKWLSLLLATILVFSLSVSPAAAKGNSGKSSSASTSSKATEETSETGSSSEAAPKTAKTPKEASQKTEAPKTFKDELNAQKEDLQQQKSDLNKQKGTLQAQYKAMLASGDADGAAALLKNIQELNQQIQETQAQIKKIINERFMVAKTLYTDDELAQFSSVSELIDQMYADAEVLRAGSVTVNNQIIKFDTPAYIKNGTILVPLRAIAEKVGGEVTWNSETQTVTITKDSTVIEITPGSMTALVNGEPVKMDLSATVTCGRTYIPLRLLAQAFNLETEQDSENGTVDIEDGTADTGSTGSTDSVGTSTGDAAANTAAADSTNTDTTSSDAAQG